jgi:hypothetical protein
MKLADKAKNALRIQEEMEALSHKPRSLRRGIARVLARGHKPRFVTGQPAHFKQWKEEAPVTKYLRNMTLTWLAEAIERRDLKGEERRISYVIGRTLRALQPHYANIWVLSRETDRARLLGRSGVGVVGLGHLEDHLRAHAVKLGWDKNGN